MYFFSEGGGSFGDSDLTDLIEGGGYKPDKSKDGGELFYVKHATYWFLSDQYFLFIYF